ncbi:MAG: site-2 protease family protein [Pseudomonadota bacterium]
MAGVSVAPTPPSLIRLRQDLKLTSGPPLENGAPTWTLHDPVRNLFFRIGRLEFAMLNHWRSTTPEKLLAAMHDSMTLAVTLQDIQLFNTFLSNNLLALPDSPESLALLRLRVQKKNAGGLTWLLKNYLFFRLPLFKPDRFLDVTLPFARLFVSNWFLFFLLGIGLFGIFQVMRQWQVFIHTFPYFFSTSGLIYYGITLFITKLFHELGHSYTAKFYGLHVPTIGIAFLVLWPVLYSDSSEAWRLKSKKARIHIVIAGIAVELGLALLATFLWAFLPDGPLRSSCFIMATVTWISSLFINLSPFFRFDGSYLLSDMWEMPNLHSRAFALGKWQIRKSFLGLNRPCPENLPAQKRRLIIAFAYCTWIYRLLVFLGIALMVYHFFVKVVGIALFIVELFYFLTLPIYKECHMWWKMRREIGVNLRPAVSFFFPVAMLLLLFVPIDTMVRVPALLKPGVPYKIYPPISAQLVKVGVTEGSSVQQGELLFELTSPRLAFSITSLEIKTEMLKVQLQRLNQKSDLLEQRHVIQQKLTSALTELTGYLKQKQQLQIRAPIKGTVRDLAPGLVVGTSVNSNRLMAIVTTTETTLIEGFPDENQRARIIVHGQAKFYPESGDFTPLSCRTRSINQTGESLLDEPYLASIYGGEIAVRLNNNRLISEKSLYRVILEPIEGQQALPNRIQPGTLVMNGKPESIAGRALQKFFAVIIRESGF